MVTAITDYDQVYLQVTNDGVDLLIKKTYVDVRINNDDPNIVDFRWHWYEFNNGQRLFLLDYTRFTPVFYASAAALLAAIQGMVYSAGGFGNIWWVKAGDTATIPDNRENIVSRMFIEGTLTTEGKLTILGI